jgi:hypothetical protein
MGHLLVWITQGWLNQEPDTLGSFRFRLASLIYLLVSVMKIRVSLCVVW